MTTQTTKLIVFTDLDGTLLDHDTYSFEAARPALDRLKRHHVPIILTTSKTWAEVQELQVDLGITAPCIVENGSALYLGTDECSQALKAGEHKVFGKTYEEICTFVDQLPSELREKILGFSDLGDKGVVKATGLPLAKAQKARDRLASEPFLWSGDEDDLDQLKLHILNADLGLLQGGRFYHILSKVDKSKAIDWLMRQARLAFSHEEFYTCALGDGPNDIQMIAKADTGVVIANPKGVALDVENINGDLIYTSEIGPAGWSVALNELMDKLGYGG